MRLNRLNEVDYEFGGVIRKRGRRDGGIDGYVHHTLTIYTFLNKDSISSIKEDIAYVSKINGDIYIIFKFELLCALF